MKDLKTIRENLISKEIPINDLNLSDNLDVINLKIDQLLSIKILSQSQFEELEDLIMILLDYYTYSEDGSSLVLDATYDKLMNHYIGNGGSLITHSDLIVTDSKWKFVDHECPGMVGSIKKIYTIEELYLYWKGYSSEVTPRKFIIAPKYDGISSAIKFVYKNGNLKLDQAVTRNDGVKGQLITEVVKKIIKDPKNKSLEYMMNHFGLKTFKFKDRDSLWIKTEIVIDNQMFKDLNDHRSEDGEKLYSNRRSATSAIVNNPKNLKYSNYLTIIPLAGYHPEKNKLIYRPYLPKELANTSTFPNEIYYASHLRLMEDIDDLLFKIKTSSFPYRCDGVVIYPLGDDLIINYADIMDNSIAYKVNDSTALTTIEYGYMTIGRLGKATPMLKVKPVEVNETVVEDVSLGSFDKFVNLGLYENEEIVVFSAGDVIPQVKLPKYRHFDVDAKPLKIKKKCPYCNVRLTRSRNTYICANLICPRRVTGRISNFIIKLGIENIADKTIEDLYDHKLVSEISDLFELTSDQITQIDGYGVNKAQIILDEIERLREKEIPVSRLLGALGIQGIGEKKCKKILRETNLQEILNDPSKAFDDILGADDIGVKTATVFLEFVTDNDEDIKKLIRKMNIIHDIAYKGNVVFTGFRNNELEKEFNKLGYEVSSNINSDTIAVINSSYDKGSIKCQTAYNKGIDVIHVLEVDNLLRTLGKKV